MGDILFTSSTENPASYYLGTTWELLPENKFLKTGATPLQQAGNNSISITKANLPAEKLQIDSFSLTRGTMDIAGQFSLLGSGTTVGGWSGNKCSGAFTFDGDTVTATIGEHVRNTAITYKQTRFTASKSWTGNTSSATPYTNVIGNGTPITINPEHIIIKAWKRLS